MLDNIDMFRFVPSKEMKINILEEQKEELCTKETIIIACLSDGVMAFDIYLQDKIIGFAMFSNWEPHNYFLWNYAIDMYYQNKGYGSKALLELFTLMKNEYDAKEISTTYIYGNEHAKHVYEKVGFVETDVIDEPDCHEVNMLIKL